MNTNSSFTVVATSELLERVGRAIAVANGKIGDARTSRIVQLQGRIRHLESRGFIKRQEFRSPSTGEFEQKLVVCGRK